MLTLYGFGPTRGLRPLWALRELGVAFDEVSVDILSGAQRLPAFLTLNPVGKVPVLLDGDLALSESVAICSYLAEKYPQTGLLPADPVERAEVNRWMLFAVTELEQPLWRITRHTYLYPEQNRSPADVTLASAEFATMAAILEDHMADRRFVAGDSFTIADIVTAHTLDWANETGLLADFPRLVGYLGEMYARPHAAPRIAQAMQAANA
jgi:glutathione S-transferase